MTKRKREWVRENRTCEGMWEEIQRLHDLAHKKTAHNDAIKPRRGGERGPETKAKEGKE